MNKFKVIFFTILLTGFLGACDQDRPKPPLQWREEVQLADGRVVWVERTASADGMREMGGPSGIKNEHYSVRFSPPGDAPLPVWEGVYRPMILDYDADKKEWYIVSSFFYGCETWLKLEQPKYPYIEYAFRDGAWMRVPLNEGLVGHKTNMYGEIDFEKGEAQSIDLQQKSRQRVRAWGLVYQRIINIEEVKSEYNYIEKCKNYSLTVCSEPGFKDCKIIDYKEGLSKW